MVEAGCLVAYVHQMWLQVHVTLSIYVRVTPQVSQRIDTSVFTDI